MDSATSLFLVSFCRVTPHAIFFPHASSSVLLLALGLGPQLGVACELCVPSFFATHNDRYETIAPSAPDQFK